MSDFTAGSAADEVEALRRQLALQQQLLAQNEAQLKNQILLLSDKDRELEKKQCQLDECAEHIAWLEETLALLKSQRYRHSSEKLDGLQGMLFDESEMDASIREIQERLDKEKQDRETKRAAQNQERAAKRPPENRPRRKPLPDHLRRLDIDVDVSAEDKHAMGDEWEFIGWECSEQLACQEREYFVKRIRRAKYVRKQQHPLDKSDGIKVAPVLPVMLPRAIADASLLAKIVTAKFVDALSFNRECKVLEREGVDISYSTLCSYPIQLHERLEPLKALFYEYAADQRLWHLDETSLQVLQEPGREPRQKSYLWAMRAGPIGKQLVMFHYDERRNYEALSAWLEEPLKRFKGVIITDEHKPYQRLANTNSGILARGGCWAHARRKLVDAVKGRRHSSDAHRLVEEIARLYKLEEKVSHSSGEQKLAQREKLIRPWLKDFKEQVDELVPQYLTKGLMRTALFYIQNNWQSLTAFMDHADLPLDNNPVENAIRPFTLGRRNWLYSASPRGAHASAFMYSLVESAKACGLEPRAYLQALFERYPLATTVEQRRRLLPMFFDNS
jgi:transposase